MKGGIIIMVLFTILLIMAVLLFIAGLIIVSVGGTAFIIVFADVIVCVGFIVLIMRYLIKRKK